MILFQKCRFFPPVTSVIYPNFLNIAANNSGVNIILIVF